MYCENTTCIPPQKENQLVIKSILNLTFLVKLVPEGKFEMSPNKYAGLTLSKLIVTVFPHLTIEIILSVRETTRKGPSYKGVKDGLSLS